MAKHQTRKDNREGGFTLVELLIVVVVVPLVIGAISFGLVSVFKMQHNVQSRTTNSADAQSISTYFQKDVQSATNVTTAPVTAGAGQQLALANGQALCGTGGTNLVSFKWAQGQTVVSYVQTPAGIERRLCTLAKTSKPSNSVVVGSSIKAVPSLSCSTSMPTCSQAAATEFIPITGASTVSFDGDGNNVITAPVVGSGNTGGGQTVNWVITNNDPANDPYQNGDLPPTSNGCQSDVNRQVSGSGRYDEGGTGYQNAPAGNKSFANGDDITFAPGVYPGAITIGANSHVHFTGNGDYDFQGGLIIGQGAHADFGKGTFHFEGNGLNFGDNDDVVGTNSLFYIHGGPAIFGGAHSHFVLHGRTDCNGRTIWDDDADHHGSNPCYFGTSGSDGDFGGVYVPHGDVDCDVPASNPCQFSAESFVAGWAYKSDGSSWHNGSGHDPSHAVDVDA